MGSHLNDTPHPPGSQKVRLNGLIRNPRTGGLEFDTTMPMKDRMYVLVRTGYGEGIRVRNIRGFNTPKKSEKNHSSIGFRQLPRFLGESKPKKLTGRRAIRFELERIIQERHAKKMAFLKGGHNGGR